MTRVRVRKAAPKSGRRQERAGAPRTPAAARVSQGAADPEAEERPSRGADVARLRPRQVRFAIELATAKTIKEAAERAGYDGASKWIYKLARLPEIRAVTRARQRELAEVALIDAASVVRELWRLATKRRVNDLARVKALDVLLRYLGSPVAPVQSQGAGDTTGRPLGEEEVLALARQLGVPLERRAPEGLDA